MSLVEEETIIVNTITGSKMGGGDAQKLSVVGGEKKNISSSLAPTT